MQLSNTLWHRASPDQWSHRYVAPFSVACFKHQHKRKNLSSSCNNVTVRSDDPIINCELVQFEWFWFEMTETSSSKVMLMWSGPHRYTSWGKTWQVQHAITCWLTANHQVHWCLNYQWVKFQRGLNFDSVILILILITNWLGKALHLLCQIKNLTLKIFFSSCRFRFSTHCSDPKSYYTLCQTRPICQDAAWLQTHLNVGRGFRCYRHEAPQQRPQWNSESTKLQVYTQGLHRAKRENGMPEVVHRKDGGLAHFSSLWKIFFRLKKSM